jgi:hypothetical protein
MVEEERKVYRWVVEWVCIEVTKEVEMRVVNPPSYIFGSIMGYENFNSRR